MKNFKRMFLIFSTCLTQTVYASVCNRTPQIRDVLVAAIGKPCKKITKSDLLRIWNLDLRKKGIKELRSGDFKGLVNLRILYLSDNGLEGSIPKELGKLKYLEELILSRNRLSGPIPKELGKLGHLRYLSIHHNQLSGSIPKELGSLGDLEELLLDNNRLSGSIPKELGDLVSLGELSLHDNQLSGSIPKALGKLKLLEGLYLHINQLSGSIPKELTKATALGWLSLFDNKGLSGPIPEELLPGGSGVFSGDFRYEGTSLTVEIKDVSSLCIKKIKGIKGIL